MWRPITLKIKHMEELDDSGPGLSLCFDVFSGLGQIQMTPPKRYSSVMQIDNNRPSYVLIAISPPEHSNKEKQQSKGKEDDSAQRRVINQWQAAQGAAAAVVAATAAAMMHAIAKIMFLRSYMHRALVATTKRNILRLRRWGAL